MIQNKKIINIKNFSTRMKKYFFICFFVLTFFIVSVSSVFAKNTDSYELIKGELVKVSDKIIEIVPDTVSEKVSIGFGFTEEFRIDALSKIKNNKKQTEEKLLKYKSFADGTQEENLESATEKPIAETKLFFLKVLDFVFSNKIVFYIIAILFIFYLFHKIYRFIRNK